MKIKLASPVTCTACMACIDSCSHDALDFETDNNGFFKIRYNESACIACGLCTETCPIINEEKPSDEYLKSYSFQAKSESVLENSASGGAFGELASLFLSSGGIVYGAVIDGFEIRHKRIDSFEDLKFVQGSKYQPSIAKGIYKQVRKDLIAGREVLFSGLSCQIAGLYSFLKKIDKSRLYTIDTICGGVGSLLPMYHLAKSGRYKSIISFRNKTNGWKSKGFKYNLVMQLKNGNYQFLGDDNLVIDAFKSPFCKRASCLNCKFVGVNRLSDATIGDFWGKEISEGEEESKGVSAILIHAERMNSLLQKADAILSKTDWKQIAKGNPKLYFSHSGYLLHTFCRKRLLNALKHNKKYEFKSISSDFLTKLEIKIYSILHRSDKLRIYNKIKQDFQ